MSLKSDIVVKNKFTVKRENIAKGKRKGSRGSRPGAFVMSYMSRDENEATESIAPFSEQQLTQSDKERIVSFLRRDGAKHDAEDVKLSIKDVDGLGGRSFGYSGISLSDDRLRKDSTIIQQAYDDSHAVQLMVLSFSHKYLVENHVLDDDYEHKGYGSYVNMYDQMKMRLAITNGVNQMLDVGNYADPMWVATLQADTAHLHCHLAIADREFSPERMKSDGYDRGVINDEEAFVLRRGITDGLEASRHYTFLNKNNEKEKQSVRNFVKDIDYSEAVFLRQLQLVMTQLPTDKDKWSYESTDESMLQANMLASEAVSIARMSYDDVTDDTSKAVNNLYAYFKSVNGVVNSDVLRAQSASTAELEDVLNSGVIDDFDIVLFEYNKRLYSSRKERYGERLKKMQERYVEFKQTDMRIGVAPDAYTVGLFYLSEMRYLSDVYSKYNAMIPNLSTEGYSTDGLQARIEDAHTISELSEDFYTGLGYDTLREAENDEIFDVVFESYYGISNGKARVFYVDQREDLISRQTEIADVNLQLFLRGDISAAVYQERLRLFETNEDVSKSDVAVSSEAVVINLQDLDTELKFTNKTLRDFQRDDVEAAVVRYGERGRLYAGAIDYLNRTGQSDLVHEFDEVADELNEQRVFVQNQAVKRESVPVVQNRPSLQRDDRIERVMSLDTPRDVIEVMNSDDFEL